MNQAVIVLTCLIVAIRAYSTSHPGAARRVEGAYNVHLVPHTHDDVGWLKTVDQYYYGANNSIQFAGVQYILDTVIEELRANPNRKFIYVEQAFFQRWWDEQDDFTRKEVQRLVRDKQLEFINGGWCMHDEAATHYVAMIDQTTLGHRRILEQFGVVPTIGWQIDPFGHSSTQAALLSARVGFKGLFFARIDYQDSERRAKDKDYEMIWRPSPSLGAHGQVFTGAFEKNGYGPPPGFNWDIRSEDAPIQDDPRLEDYNVPERVESFVKTVMDQFSVNRGNDIMLTLGSDFEYSAARTWFKNLDKLIEHVNKDGRINIFYSTPSQYVDAKMASGVSWSVKTDDFFPYADCPHCYWTGYFTSRTLLKRYVRINSHYLNFARQLSVFGGVGTSATREMDEAVGVAQHHDGVSGTSKQHVAYDYARGIAKGRSKAEQYTNDYFNGVVAPKDGSKPSFAQCQLVNESICEVTQTAQGFTVVLYNSLARARTESVRIPVSGNCIVYDSKGATVASETLPSFTPFAKKGTKPAPYNVYFSATVPGLGWSTYFVQLDSSKAPGKFTVLPRGTDAKIQNSKLVVTFAGSTGRLAHIQDVKSGLSTQISHDFLFYKAWQSGDQNSGAYIFRPAVQTPTSACPQIPTLSVFNSATVQEIRVTYCNWIALVARLSGSDGALEFNYELSSIPISDGIGKEVISRFSSDLKSQSLFYTDSNGREYQTRKLNYRPSWNLTVTEPVSGNYYPINVGAYLKDTNRQLSFLVDRSIGGGSIADGQAEFLIQRRLLADDARGVGEPLNETDGITPYPDAQRIGDGIHVSGTQYLLLDAQSVGVRAIRAQQSRLFQPFIVATTPIGGSKSDVQKWISTHTLSGSELASELPLNVELMTLQPLSRTEYLLRLSHQFAVGEDSVYSGPVTVDLAKLFAKLHLKDLKELSLTANQPVSNIKIYEWKTEGSNQFQNQHAFPIVPLQGSVVTINPMDIRTFSFQL